MAKPKINFDTSSYPCYVMSLTNLCGLDKLPIHEDAHQAGLLQILTISSQAPT